ncbi:MAG: response regulator [Patescibacteria group bacterium]
MEEKKYKILIVDDDKFLLNMYSVKFGKNGFDVVTAENGEDAIARIKEGLSPDVVLLDIIMPGLDGVGVLERVRKEKLAPNAAFIMLTNQGGEEDIYNVKRFNIDGYIIKATTMPSEVIDEVLRLTKAHHKS